MRFLAGLIIGVLLVVGAAFAYFLSGSAPVATADKTMPFEKMLANGALHARIKKEATARGLLVYPGGGTVDGRRGDHVLLAPPYISSRADLQEIATRLAAAVEAATASTVAL